MKVKSDLYRPQRSWGKAMFLHVSVILFTGGVPGPGGAWSRGICSLGGLLWEGVPAPGGACSRGGAWSGGGASGTHPTGMHSC